LLNTILTVRSGCAFSHSKKGWEIFTDCIISHLNEREKPIVFLLWGRPAREKQTLITNKNHYVLTAAHPSPLSASRGFFGCRHFSKTNKILTANGMQPIDWQL
jgi:uracil-DNA glycosylase